ncbi:hypothetical protein B0J12DRAFT_649573 [Macrophomina phaseolina]|uniref:Pentatricopeptide repeat-containing protein n=1 Tax=Macrophomina phaseolina TaxID=35725 RepID=A0ABQ8GMJ5_9PEZI|nr:hypothetical protein B0J12DRAFT_649573 [Macrophomina phaseolina]
MKSPTRSFLRRPLWLDRPNARSFLDPRKSLPGQAGIWRAQDVRKTELDDVLERASGQPSSPLTADTLLDRATALRVKEYLRAREGSLLVRCLLPRARQVYLERFNRCLSMADLYPKDRETAKELWRLYIKLQLSSSGFLHAMSARAWDVLWASQSLRTPAEPKIVAHLVQLAEDMRRGGHQASFGQRLIHIETLFWKDNKERAIDEWERGYKTKAGRTEDSYRPEYLDLGVRMHAVAGNLLRARDLLATLFASHPDWNPRLILYVFDAYVALPDRPGRHKYAWSLYKRLQELLLDQMTLEDYERCYVGFLKAGSRSRAVEVFQDLLHHGHKVNATIVQSFSKLAHNPDQVNEAFLAGILSVSSAVQNKGYYADWINLLTRRGHADAAAQVVELMYERGVAPEDQHLNSLINAWIRIGTPELLQKAETLGLQMVVERISQVRRRTGESDLIKNGPQEGLKSPQKLFLRRTIPPASSHTFELLATIYIKQGNKKKLADLHLWQTQHARLPTTTAALNAEMAHFLRHGYLPDVWRVFKREVLRRPTQDLARTRPDTGTFMLLWEASRTKPRTLTRSHLYRLGDRTSFPPPTIILRHTLSWLSSLAAADCKPRNRRPATTNTKKLLTQISSSRLPTLIIRTFAAWTDITGALVALHALASPPLAIPPTQRAIHLIAQAVARAAVGRGRGTRTPRQRREVAASSALAHNLEQVLRALRALLERRLAAEKGGWNAAVAEEGEGEGEEQTENKKKKQKNEIFLDALAELVRAALIRQGVRPREVEGRIAGVKRAIGAEGLRVGDKDAWEVARELGVWVEEGEREAVDGVRR